MGRRLLLLGAALIVALAVPAHALDNPDAPDRNAEFLARAQPFEQRVADASSSTDGHAAAAAYAAFLDAELNRAYQALLAHLTGEARRALVSSQRQWLRYRDTETQFIDRNWVPQNFGSSSALSRAGYRGSLVKQRVLSLLAYLNNYPPGAN
jgi:uncharacterized protein YecT (DUF1311 family)